jgi:hypothetical protein
LNSNLDWASCHQGDDLHLSYPRIDTFVEVLEYYVRELFNEESLHCPSGTERAAGRGQMEEATQAWDNRIHVARPGIDSSFIGNHYLNQRDPWGLAGTQELILNY